MKIKLLKKYNQLISIFLTLTGVGGFVAGCEELSPGMEYGTPSATFRVNGTVKTETNAAIPAIRVIMASDTAFTDANGVYTTEVINFPEDQQFEMKFEDIDGAQNGSYRTYDTIAIFTDPQFTDGDGSWYEGVTTTEINIKMQPGN